MISQGDLKSVALYEANTKLVVTATSKNQSKP